MGRFGGKGGNEIGGYPSTSSNYGVPIQPSTYGAPIQRPSYGAPVQQYGTPTYSNSRSRSLNDTFNFETITGFVWKAIDNFAKLNNDRNSTSGVEKSK